MYALYRPILYIVSTVTKCAMRLYICTGREYVGCMHGAADWRVCRGVHLTVHVHVVTLHPHNCKHKVLLRWPQKCFECMSVRLLYTYTQLTHEYLSAYRRKCCEVHVACEPPYCICTCRDLASAKLQAISNNVLLRWPQKCFECMSVRLLYILRTTEV